MCATVRAQRSWWSMRNLRVTIRELLLRDKYQKGWYITICFRYILCFNRPLFRQKAPFTLIAYWRLSRLTFTSDYVLFRTFRTFPPLWHWFQNKSTTRIIAVELDIWYVRWAAPCNFNMAWPTVSRIRSTSLRCQLACKGDRFVLYSTMDDKDDVRFQRFLAWLSLK